MYFLQQQDDTREPKKKKFEKTTQNTDTDQQKMIRYHSKMYADGGAALAGGVSQEKIAQSKHRDFREPIACRTRLVLQRSIAGVVCLPYSSSVYAVRVSAWQLVLQSSTSKRRRRCEMEYEDHQENCAKRSHGSLRQQQQQRRQNTGQIRLGQMGINAKRALQVSGCYINSNKAEMRARKRCLLALPLQL